MCDYSLEAYKTRPARAGETISTQRFPSGSIGFVGPENETVCVCLAADTRLELAQLPAMLSNPLGIRGAVEVTFTQLDTTGYRDAVRFPGGQVVSLQQLGGGVTARVINALDGVPSQSAHASEAKDETPVSQPTPETV